MSKAKQRKKVAKFASGGDINNDDLAAIAKTGGQSNGYSNSAANNSVAAGAPVAAPTMGAIPKPAPSQDWEASAGTFKNPPDTPAAPAAAIGATKITPVSAPVVPNAWNTNMSSNTKMLSGMANNALTTGTNNPMGALLAAKALRGQADQATRANSPFAQGQDAQAVESQKENDPNKNAQEAARANYYNRYNDMLVGQNKAAKAPGDLAHEKIMNGLRDEYLKERDPARREAILAHANGYAATFGPNAYKTQNALIGQGMGLGSPNMQFEHDAKGGVVGRAGGGSIGPYGTQQDGAIGYARGGDIQPPMTYGAAPSMPAVHPMLAQYGQYLSEAKKVGVMPVPADKYFNIVSGIQGGMPGNPASIGMGFAEGGDVDVDIPPSNYAVPANVNWLDIAKQGMNNLMHRTPAPISVTAAPTSPINGTSGVQSQQDTGEESQVNRAHGGAIPVAGKKLIGPGTGTSDSIPAVIDGHRPAALSSGEFVIPAHVVRAKGTEFFEKLIGAHDKGTQHGGQSTT